MIHRFAYKTAGVILSAAFLFKPSISAGIKSSIMILILM